MRALQLEKPREFRFFDAPEAQPPGPGEALVRVRKVGVCGTDISGYLGKMPFFSYPRIPGHELGVEVLAVGAGVTNVKPGDTCSVEPYINCETCFSCLRKRGNCCESLTVLGVHIDGGLRPRFVLPARKLHPAQGLSFEQLALVETLAIGCHAVARGNPQPGDHVLVPSVCWSTSVAPLLQSGLVPVFIDVNRSNDHQKVLACWGTIGMIATVSKSQIMYHVV
jgi:alcohol dehydrogenase